MGNMCSYVRKPDKPQYWPMGKPWPVEDGKGGYLEVKEVCPGPGRPHNRCQTQESMPPVYIMTDGSMVRGMDDGDVPKEEPKATEAK